MQSQSSEGDGIKVAGDMQKSICHILLDSRSRWLQILLRPSVLDRARPPGYHRVLPSVEMHVVVALKDISRQYCMEMAPKLSQSRVSEQQCSMEIAQILAVTRFGATVLYGHQGPVPHPGPRGCQCCVSKRVQENMVDLGDDFFWPSTSPFFLAFTCSVSSSLDELRKIRFSGR